MDEEIINPALGLEEEEEEVTSTMIVAAPKVGELPGTISTGEAVQKTFDDEIVVTHQDSPGDTVESEEEELEQQLLMNTTAQNVVDDSPLAPEQEEEDDLEEEEEETVVNQLSQETVEETALETATAIIEQVPVLHVPAMMTENTENVPQQQQQEVPAWRQATTDSSLQLLSLPIDALHCIASFVTAADWAHFGQTNTMATPICRNVFQRVRMHGFRCATECVTAWKLGQHADARELSALYIKSGVPIYPAALGHSYHTLVWRMGVEAREMEQVRAADEEENEDETVEPIDAFFTGRYESRNTTEQQEVTSTYLEEKCLFCYNKAAETDSRLGIRVSMTSRTTFAPPPPPPAPVLQGAWDGRTRLPGFRPAAEAPAAPSPPRSISPTNNGGGLVYQDASRVPPKVQVSMHRHLVDQHMMGRRAVEDEDGAMMSLPISLAADFFHQNLVNVEQQQYEPLDVPDLLEGDRRFPMMQEHHNPNGQPGMFVTRAGSTYTPGYQFPEDVDSDGPPDFGSETSYGTPLEQQASNTTSPPPLPPPPVPTPDELSSSNATSNAEPTILSSVNLEIYTSADGTSGDLKSHLMTRYAVYQRRLETFLSHNDSPGFEECLFDFWDEFLPTTTNVHFHDRNTAVPRISRLQKFLSKPCPKAFGVVQCEIERIKINSKRKGMKGRLFPTYEYRLFVRDKRHEAAESAITADEQQQQPVRRDTILMMAKNRGRKHQESTGVMPAPGSSKKGVNNYYLYMPQQVDVDTHYRVVNNSDDAELIPNGASSVMPTRMGEAPDLLGRLQSNFIGTEFQIFTPTLQKQQQHNAVLNNTRKPARSNNVPSSDESESDYEASSDTQSAYNNSRRRNRFRRRRSYNGNNNNGALECGSERRHHPEPIEEEEESEDRRRKTRRAYSLPNFRRSTRSSRRAVASTDSLDTLQQNMLYEEEDGAITYTANLLGNRPRIMDVCVPRVSDEGPGAEWRRYLGSVEDSNVEGGSAANSMLNHFKQVQQRLETTADNNENETTTAAGYTPPDDFGLLALQNRPPWWNVELGAFVLNFGGRVSVASVKNFQLCDRNDQDHIMLQFGRIQGRHSFTMDFQHPLTAVQAFAIAISSLQSRISFG